MQQKRFFTLSLWLISAIVLTLFAACKKTNNQPTGFIAQPIADTLTNFRAIKGGTFTRGDKELTNATPHKVNISSFYMGETEVTRAQWKAFLNKKANYGSSNNINDFTIGGWNETDQHPVANVNWFDAVRFSNYYTKEILKTTDTAYVFIRSDSVVCNKNAKGARLPTEAEWEYACRGGTQTPYYTGWMVTRSYANYDESGITKTTPVVSYINNPYGLYDILGNVWEWCSDWYKSDYYPTDGSVQNNPIGPTIGLERVARGGSWANSVVVLRAAFRGSGNPGIRSFTVGLRLAKTM